MIPAVHELVYAAYENRSLHPSLMDDMGIEEPLRSWLGEHAPIGT